MFVHENKNWDFSRFFSGEETILTKLSFNIKEAVLLNRKILGKGIETFLREELIT